MQVMLFNQETITAGRQSFTAGMYEAAVRTRRERCVARSKGVQAVPGAIVAALEMGLTFANNIVPAVSRVTGCRRSTVRTVLETLGGESFADRLWKPSDKAGYYRLLRVTPRVASAFLATF